MRSWTCRFQLCWLFYMYNMIFLVYYMHASLFKNTCWLLNIYTKYWKLHCPKIVVELLIYSYTYIYLYILKACKDFKKNNWGSPYYVSFYSQVIVFIKKFKFTSISWYWYCTKYITCQVYDRMDNHTVKCSSIKFVLIYINDS